MKKCTKCGLEKCEKEFYKRSKEKLECFCKPCFKERLKKKEERDPEKYRRKSNDKARKYREENYERIKKYRDEYEKINREKIKKQRHEDYLKNKEKVLEQTKKWRQLNKEKFKQMWLKSSKKYPLKRPARKILNWHVEAGNIIRPDKCEMCDKNCKPEAHHEDYSKPLDVKWVCSCHTIIHYEVKKT